MEEDACRQIAGLMEALRRETAGGKPPAGRGSDDVPGAGLWEFGIASSAMHMAWVRTVCCRLKNDFSYSRDLCWNPFPWPDASPERKADIEKLAGAVLAVRDRHAGRTLAALYDPESMPADLRDAHAALDQAADALYRPEPFRSDEERICMLFALYEQLVKTAEQSAKEEASCRSPIPFPWQA